MEDRRELSRRLYDVLEKVGASEEMRQLHQHTASTREILSTVSGTLDGLGQNVKYCGSSYEGSVTPDLASDVDIIYLNSWVPVVADVLAAQPGISLLMVRDDWTHHGYTKLQWVLDGQPQTTDHGHPPAGFEFDTTGKLCLKHVPLPNRQGPAVQFVFDGRHIADHVPAFQCKSIPNFLMDCLSRPRPYERSVELQAMSDLGCLLVFVGHIGSNEKDIEWRISFSLQEKQLMSRLNAVQHKVYILLKMIKKNIIKETLNEEILTSYHCKTCILYTVQMTAARVWIDESLINCLFLCLKLLTKWIEKGKCPSYWFNDQNLFMKANFPRLRSPLLQLMRQLLERGTDILYLIQCDNVGDILRNGDWRRYRELSTVHKNSYASTLKSNCSVIICKSAHELLYGLNRGGYDPVTLATALSTLQMTDTINGHTTEVTQSALAYLYPHLHLHIAKGLVSMIYRHPDTVDQQRVMEIADFHFNEARGLDLVNERLARASVLYRSEHYDECFDMLKNVENYFTNRVLLHCPCTMVGKRTYYDMQDLRRQHEKIADMTLKKYSQTLRATCVIFLPSELEVAPAPLQYELQRSLGTMPGSRFWLIHYWFDWAVVDPRLYLYFLQYLVSSKLHKDVNRQEAIVNLRGEIALDDLGMLADGKSRMGHKDTAYNLLGWICMQEGRLDEAARCFSQSWGIRPYHNAAKFHMARLLDWDTVD